MVRPPFRRTTPPYVYRLLLAATTALVAVPAGFPPGAAAQVSRVEFTPTPAPATADEMAVDRTTSTAVITYADGSTATVPLAVNRLFSSGDPVGDREAGLIVDRDGRPIDRSAPIGKGGDIARGPFHAYSPDANSLIRVPDARVPGVAGHPLFLVTHFESHTEAPNLDPSKPPVGLYGQLPMIMNRTVVDQDPATGALKAVRTDNVDMAPVGGLWTPCAGSLTPWGSHLGSEEYEPNAAYYETRPLEPMNLFLGTPGKTAAEGGARSYAYGFPVEVKVDAAGNSRAEKRYGMGRVALELADFMPDRRTAYLGDDGRDVVRLMYVADRPADPTAGTLYAARWEQTGAEAAGTARLSWIRLGHATEAEIKALIDRGIRFSDIFEAVDAETYRSDPARYQGFTPVHVYPGTGGSPRLDHLKVRAGMETAAAFLETRRFAALKGATVEFTKMEGQTHDPRDRKLYTALSSIEKGMIDGRNGERPADHIALAADSDDLGCGAVYESRMTGGVRDTEGAAIDSEWVAVDMTGVVMGARKPAGQTAYGAYDSCDTDKVAGPDNIKFSPMMRTLFIGEDSGDHLNNFVWAFNVDTGRLVRIFSARAGAENTGLQVVDDYNGFAYILGNVQHPGADLELKKHPDEIKIDLSARIDPRGSVGYLAALPVRPPR